jgi:hypothetical protein
MAAPVRQSSLEAGRKNAEDLRGQPAQGFVDPQQIGLAQIKKHGNRSHAGLIVRKVIEGRMHHLARQQTTNEVAGRNGEVFS